jgi:hypothetical protein
MMRKVLLAAVVTAVLPASSYAQGFGAAARAGTFGFGGELAVQLTNTFAVRGGFGTFPGSVSGDFTEVVWTVTPPKQMLNIGIDVYPGWSDFRIGAGVLKINDETDLEAKLRQNSEFEIGDRVYTSDQVVTLTGTVDHGGMAPYVNFGGGRHSGPGLGIFVDIGAAFLKEQSVALIATGPYANNPEFQQSLERERVKVEDEVKKYVKVLPQFSVGLRYGF